MEVGQDRFRAHVILQACRAEGLLVELMAMDSDAAWASFQPYRLVVRSEDLPEVKRIAARG